MLQRNRGIFQSYRFWQLSASKHKNLTKATKRWNAHSTRRFFSFDPPFGDMVVLGDRVLKQWCDPNENIYTSSIITYFTLTYTVIIYI